MSTRRGLSAVGPWALLAALLVLATACGSAEDPTRARRAPGPTPVAASAAHGAGDAPRADQGHLGPGSIRCSNCHTPEERGHAAWRETAMRLGHDVQARLAERKTCTCCHLGEVKGGDPLDRTCTSCHDDIRVTITKMGSMHCVSCHDPTASGGMTIRESAWECKKCHAKDQGDAAAIDVHAGEDCATCHRPHQEPWTLPRPCTECHAGHETFHGPAARDADGGAPHAVAPHDAGTFSAEPMACATCHRPHEVGGAASGRCFECHAERDPRTFTLASTFAGGHDRCTTCHLPHGGEKAGPRPCRSCHEGVVTMDGPASEAHARCVNCHKPHEVRGTARTACIGCHLSVHVDHPAPESTAGSPPGATAQGCVACHEVHPGPRPRALANGKPGPTLPDAAFPRSPSPVTCSRCHTKARNDTGFHAGTTPCKGCHAPHQFTAASAPSCSKCHARETTAAKNADGHGHGACKACHAPHDPKAARPACASCHDKEASTAPAGHAQCLACHDAHPASRTPKSACATCHAQKKASGPHARVDCASCHRPHGPDAPAGPAGPASRPACTSCHEPKTLGGMHVVAGHAVCSSCHGAHTAPSSSRATCLACHESRKDHEPRAPVCSGCHGFAKGGNKR